MKQAPTSRCRFHPLREVENREILIHYSYTIKKGGYYGCKLQTDSEEQHARHIGWNQEVVRRPQERRGADGQADDKGGYGEYNPRPHRDGGGDGFAGQVRAPTDCSGAYGAYPRRGLPAPFVQERRRREYQGLQPLDDD